MGVAEPIPFPLAPPSTPIGGTVGVHGTFHQKFNFPFGGGGQAGPSGVPDLYDVSIAGHDYLIDWAADAYRHESIPQLRPTFLSDDTAGERALNPEGPIRRSQTSWHHGAGQAHFDRPDSDPLRFRSSKGVDPWTRNALTLLPDTDRVQTASGRVFLAVTGTRLYTVCNDTLTWRTTVAGSPTVVPGPVGITGLASDGTAVYTATSGGIWRDGVLWQAGPSDLIGYVKNRLLTATGGRLDNILTPDPVVIPATPLFVHPNPDWTWTAFAEGDVAIYASGNAGAHSAVYRIGITTDGTALDSPVVAGVLPDGETVTAMVGYAGFLILGTTLGVRLATTSSSGDLILGAVIETAHSVKAVHGWGRFVRFGWTGYDSHSTGLGRLDLTVLNDTAPAYASDLMCGGQGPVTGIVTFQGLTVYAVDGQGVYCETARLVGSGVLLMGQVTYDLPVPKIGLSVEVAHTEPLNGTHSVALSPDSEPYVNLGSRSAGDDTPFDARQTRGETLELRLTLTRSATSLVGGPTVGRLTLLALTGRADGEWRTIPVILAEKELNLHGGMAFRDPRSEYDFLRSLRGPRLLVNVVEGSASSLMVLEDHTWIPANPTVPRGWWQGTFVLKFKTVT